MYSSHSNVYKFNQVILQDEDALVIDNNEKVAKKIEDLQEQMIKAEEGRNEEEPSDGFLNGLDADQVEALTADTEEETPSVIKKMPGTSGEDHDRTGNQEEEPQGRGGNGAALSVVSAQAQEMLEAARREAESIKSQALSEAQKELEDLRKSTLEEAGTKGYEDGYNKGMEEAEKLRAKLKEDRSRMEAEYEQMVDELEPRFVDTLTDIYEKIFQVDLKKEHGIIMHLIASTMHKIEGNSNYLIHVSKEDYPYVNMKKNEALASAVSVNSSVEIVEDITLGANDCIIETDSGVFDCGLGTQLEELTQKLKLLSYRKD